MNKARNRALFLDRDGVINVDLGYVCSPERTQWVPGIFDLCRKATELGYLLVVVTNQAGIARGYYDESAFKDYVTWMHAEFAKRGVPITATYHCPHHPTAGSAALRIDCDCRKPKPGMLLRAQRDLDLDMGRCALIGDMPSDLQAARAAGVGRCLRVSANPAAQDGLPTVNEAIAWLATPQPEQGNSN